MRSDAFLFLIVVAACGGGTGPQVVASVSVTPPQPSMVAGQTVQLSAAAMDAAGVAIAGKTATWSSSATGFASVSGTGLVTGVAAGQATITATIDGKSGTSLVTVTPPPSAFAGTYATRVTLGQNSCGTVNVADNPTTVTQNTGSTAVVFTHAGLSYSGTVAADGTFSTTPRTVDVNDGFSYVIAIAGRFTTNAFEADATVDRTGASAACRYIVHWSASK